MSEQRIQEVRAWFQAKGIVGETLADFGVGVREDGGITFPYSPEATKIRYGVPNGARSYKWEGGVSPFLYNRRDLARDTMFLCEGETDTMRLRQEFNGTNDIGVVGIPGINTWSEDMASDLRQSKKVYVILDNDADYRTARIVDDAWRTIRRDLGRGKASRVILPRGINDLCDFFQDHSLESLRTLIERQPRAGESRFKTLDLTQEPPQPIWAIENFACKGDIHLLIGEPGIGKSWLTMGMAVAVASGQNEFIGFPIPRPDRVLYFDEENPEDLIFHRFLKLGLSAKAADNVRFVNNMGLRLDHDPTNILDEALDYEPGLIVLDSLTRFHGQDENSAGAMAELFNTAIKPLARETGAAVVLIHHANKTDSLSSYKRSRGSGDITASVDAGYDIHQTSDGSLSIKNFKSRRAVQGDSRYVSIVDRKDGRVELLGMSGISGVF